MSSSTSWWTWIKRWFRRASVAMVLVSLAVAAYGLWQFTRDQAEAFDDPAMQFKYGSTGGDRNFGIPLSVWQALPELFRRHLPEGKQALGWKAFGFLEVPADWEKVPRMTRRPAGTSVRTYQGIKRIFLNCAGCHVGSVRTDDAATPAIVAGMPANTVDLEAFQNFLIDAALDERFTPEEIIAQIDVMDLNISLYERLALRFIGIALLRQRILTIANRFRFTLHEPVFGPGRFDTFSPAKALLNWPLDDLAANEAVGVVDFPSVWLQDRKRGMQLHWDGNNTSVEERNRSAAFGTGATPPMLDRGSLRRIESYLNTAEPPAFAATLGETIDPVKEARGKQVYARQCADCHGKDGRDFSGEYVGKVTPIDEIGTDRARLDNYTDMLSRSQNVLYAGSGAERFQHFRKTGGYANMPLDGLWLRAPYLHNGSVPTLWDLLNPPDRRPAVFYRGDDVYDPVRVGFRSRAEDIPPDRLAGLFRYETRQDSSACRQPKGLGTAPGAPCFGNDNGGHLYGTSLPDADKWALIEFLKTF